MSRDQVVLVCGVAGAGKSSMLTPAARLIQEQGQQVLGLAVQNTLVQMLQRETGIPSMTVARFIKRYEALLDGGDGRLPPDAHSLKGAALLVDEASMLSNTDHLKLVTLANRLEVATLGWGNAIDRTVELVFLEALYWSAVSSRTWLSMPT